MPTTTDDDDEEHFDFEYDAQTAPDREGWLARDEQERIDAVARFHRRSPAPHPPAPNPKLHAVFHMVAENQIAANNPPEARETLVRLMAEGVDRHSAIHAISSVTAQFIWEASQPGAKMFDAEENARRLAKLTSAEWAGNSSRDPARRPPPRHLRRRR
jgi:hypothetical protein